MRTAVSIVSVLFLALCFSLSAAAAEPFNEEALYEAAKKEGEVNIYSYSSRVFKFGKTFEEKYPGIKVNGFDMDSPEIVTKVLAEQAAKNYVADVIFLKDPSTVINELYNKKLLFNYVPSDLDALIPADYKEPLLVHHASVDAFIYNNEKMSSPPIKSLWDLTKPEWKGRVIFPDPQKMSEFVEVLATIVQHADEMAAEYKKVFGEDIKLSSGVENAGYEWILRLLNNDAIILGSTNSVAKAVGLSDQANPPVGFTAYSRLRDKEKNPNLKFEVIEDVSPVMGVATDVIVGIVNEAKHPNAAKLLIRWMMGDEKGGQGYVPYYVLGNFPVRKDVPPPEGSKGLSDLKLWKADANFAWNNGQKVLDFWVANLK
ncbi:MAG TPA: ABC transporter substrate-binding protein [Deltaproteobacteria bacterium]|nr:ABC transporter substrate-binding protein [Deltaproteobacteria bacterium]HPJ94605.1 ABC transporter substrate-binding protein [Deltaproteobacteria bacterium]HPR52619.1 ABC transporter substrate-binding protein [Deltaproteobacteria bacterium]